MHTSRARIYRPAKTAMQSGRANTRDWVLEFEPREQKDHDPLMGWVGSGDMSGQIRMHFATKEEALAFARRRGFGVVALEPHGRRIKPKSYADNFRWRSPA